jgi:hypothetical protein
MRREAKRAKRAKKAKFQAFFALFVFFAFFASTLPFTTNSNFENVSRHQALRTEMSVGIITAGGSGRDST